MGLESVMICLDNSEYMRNGDYVQTRLDAQRDAVNWICEAKIQQSPENTVGILTTAGDRIEVMVTPSSDLGPVLNAIHSIQIKGQSNFLGALQVAQLALKHRPNKNHQQRIIVFVGSPITSQQKDLVRVAKALKKNNVAVDVVNFGEENTQNENVEKLEAFINAVKSGENSHLLNVPPGPHILSDIIITSPLVVDDSAANFGAAGGAAGASAAGGGAGGMLGDVDPNLDPELALALRMSLEEERQRQLASQNAGGEAAPEPAAGAPAAATGDAALTSMEEDPDLAAALAMSMQQAQQDVPMEESQQQAPAAEPSSLPLPQSQPQAQASRPQAAQAPKPQPSSEDMAQAFQDPNFMNSLLSSLPGVNPDDEVIRNILGNLGQGGSSGSSNNQNNSGNKNNNNNNSQDGNQNH